MKRISLLTAALLLVALSQSAHAQSAKDALVALKKLQMKCETGILYNEYMPALSETKVMVEDYLMTPASKNVPEFSDALIGALGHYECAGKVFDYMFKAGAGQHFVSVQNPDLFAKIRNTYPELHIYVQKDIPGFSYSEAIQVMWTRAASEVERAFDNYPSKTANAKTKNNYAKVETRSSEDQPRPLEGKLKRQINALKYENSRLRKENKELRRELDQLKGRQ